MKSFFYLFMLFGLFLISFSSLSFKAGGNVQYNDDQIKKLILMSDTLRQLGKNDRAMTLAEEAEKAAKKSKNYELLAMALNRQGKVLVAMNKRSESRFEKSNQILLDNASKNNTLILDNLNELRLAAVQKNDKKALASIDYNISRIKKGQNLEQLGDQATQLKEEIINVEQEKDKIANEKAKIQADKELLDKALKEQLNIQSDLLSDQAKLRRDSKQIQAELDKKKAEISLMTLDQAQAALNQAQQEKVLYQIKAQDSLNQERLKINELLLSDEKNKRNFYIVSLIALLGLFGSSLFGYVKSRQNAKLLTEKNGLIETERQRSDQLLLNILPESIATELKTNGFTKANHFEEVTVCFADFVGFTTIAGVTDPQKLLSQLNTCFRAFDDIIAKYNLEKIKTIGDCYMFAGGLPEIGKGSQIVEMIKAAKEMQAWLDIWNEERKSLGLARMDVRIGIHMGPVAAGVIGSKKFAYDIWGDTVNMAARLEQSSERGRINISGETYEKVKDVFKCEYRGKLPAKNKGLVDMYFVEN
ncbi:MAG: adenylate/guanylate cyclase domain-containing protein [Saprospiraceae bacterium]